MAVTRTKLVGTKLADLCILIFMTLCSPFFSGDVFGSKDYFYGLGIFFDTYSNHNGEHQVSEISFTQKHLNVVPQKIFTPLSWNFFVWFAPYCTSGNCSFINFVLLHTYFHSMSTLTFQRWLVMVLFTMITIETEHLVKWRAAQWVSNSGTKLMFDCIKVFKFKSNDS